MISAASLYSLLLLLSSSQGFRRPVHRQLLKLTVRGGSSSFPESSSSFTDKSYPDDDPPDHETVQERVNAWRKYQQVKWWKNTRPHLSKNCSNNTMYPIYTLYQETYSHLSQGEVESNRDAQGRIKLLVHVGRGSRVLIFFILMWRNVHLYEVADQTFQGWLRLITVIPLLLLFISNLAGAVASLTSPSHSAKKRLKAILNLDKFVEMLMIVFNFGRLTLFPSKYTPREIYIANTLHSVFFILQSQAFTRLTWCVIYFFVVCVCLLVGLCVCVSVSLMNLP